MQPQATLHRPGSVSGKWHIVDASRGMSARVALGKQSLVEAMLCNIPNIGLAKGGNKDTWVMCSSHDNTTIAAQFELCKHHKTDERKVKHGCAMKPSSHCHQQDQIFPGTIDKIGGGATPTEVRGGVTLAHSTDLRPGPLPDWNVSNYVACMRTTIGIMLELWWEMKGQNVSHTVADLCGHMTLPWSLDCGESSKSWEYQQVSTLENTSFIWIQQLYS